ncbi:TetR/AcrR family transcriptional regulator [Nocardia puris]|uniref:TetR/AcrR family transcriptional regulator n=1 Tax=Nocardia puris TaxID=208602 RepID=UPI0018942CF9|nr:TetR/AcrR family transcriptional regulator [Nocardia puris]MBF6211901.1 TetR/AcrR family transcriptional regulator [Nocardia puris]MBF6366928.1 TetR/AcrR family transcriptional regulator [Nocardia puris]
MPAALTAERQAGDREALLDVAESLFYAHGFQSVGMDRLRAASSLSLKRIYAMFPTKDDLAVAVLRRRDLRWRTRLVDYVERFADPTRRVLALFDWLRDWFAEPGFRGCAWINAHGELGPTSDAVLAEVRAHKEAFHAHVTGWVDAAGSDAGEAIYLLAEGAMVTAGITGDPDVARKARDAAERLLTGARP